MENLQVQNRKIVLKPIDQAAPGFLPLYRSLLAAKRAFSDFNKAVPEDVDEAMTLMRRHIVEPAAKSEKDAILESISAAEMMILFDVLMGVNIVPPANGAA